MTTEQMVRGECFCGAVEVTARGAPVAMGYCHCESCRHWSAGPVNAFTLWRPESVSITRGASQLGSYSKTPQSVRRFCKTCGGHVMTEHPTMGLTDVYSAIIPTLPFKPSVHIHYQETVLHVPDGLPKMKDVPAELGGSGTTLPD
jgi:hypothetical protein